MTAVPWSAPVPGRTSMWVEEISWWGLGTVTSRGGSASCTARLRRPADHRPPVDVDVWPLLMTRRATGTVSTWPGGCPGIPGGAAGGGSRGRAW